MKTIRSTLAIGSALAALAISGGAQAATLKSTYSGAGYVFVCHGQELTATSGLVSSVYNSSTHGDLLHEVTNVTISPSLTLHGEDGLTYSVVGKSNAVVDTRDYGTYSVASGKYSYSFTLYAANGSIYGTLKGKSKVLPNQDVEPLTGTCTQ